MKQFLILCLVFVPALGLVADDAFVDTFIEVGPLEYEGWRLEIKTAVDDSGAPAGFTFMWIRVIDWSIQKDGTTSATLHLETYLADESAALYNVDFDDQFTQSNISNGAIEIWHAFDKTNWYILGDDITVTALDSDGRPFPIYVGVRPGFSNHYGWAEFNILSPDQVEIVDNAAIFNALGGITVGRKFLFGDVNCDGQVDLLDISPFVNLLANGGFQESADFDSDGMITLLDVEPLIETINNN